MSEVAFSSRGAPRRRRRGALPAAAQVTVTDAWVRGTVTGQKATGAFMH